MKGKLSHKNRVVTHTDIQRHFPSIMLGSKVLPYATTVQKTRLSDPCQTSFQSLARGYKMYGNIVFRHIFLEKMRHCLFIQAIREYNLKSPHYGTLISCLVVIILKRPIKWCNLLSYMIFIHTYIYYRRTDYSFRPELFFSSFFKEVCTLSLFVCLSTNFWYSQRFSSVWT